MKENGETIGKKAMEFKTGEMESTTKENGLKDTSMEQDSSSLAIAASIKENSTEMRSTGLGSITGTTQEHMKDSGNITECLEEEN
jgi:hypothetical protein